MSIIESAVIPTVVCIEAQGLAAVSVALQIWHRHFLSAKIFVSFPAAHENVRTEQLHVLVAWQHKHVYL